MIDEKYTSYARDVIDGKVSSLSVYTLSMPTLPKLVQQGGQIF